MKRLTLFSSRTRSAPVREEEASSPAPASPPVTPPSPAPDGVTRILGAYVDMSLLFVAAQLRIVDIIGDAVKSGAEIVAGIELTPLDAEVARRVLRGLVNCGVLVESAEDRYGVTADGARLRSDRPDSLRDLVLVQGGLFYRSLAGLLATTQTGEPAFAKVFGEDFFSYLGHQPAIGAAFNRVMVARTQAIAQAALAAYDWPPVRTLVDVGGGYGALTVAALRAFPQLCGVVVDRPAVIEEARAYLASTGLADRCELMSGDFFDSLPTGGDVYALSQILHDWDDERCVRILSNCAAAMGAQGRALVIEQLLPQRLTGPSQLVRNDLIILTLTGGRERTEAEYRALFARAGLRLARVIPAGPWSLLEGVTA